MEVNKESAPMKAGRSGKQVKFFAGGAIVVLVIAYLIFSSMKGATAEYVTTSEAKAVGLANRMVRVSGVIVGDTINWDAQGLLLKFELSDDAGRLPVVYKGLRPDMFQDGATAIAEGKMGADGVFQASQILLKCPSKYEAKATEQAPSK